MEAFENVIWAVMLGGLLTIGTMAVVDVALTRTLVAWRGLVFMTVTGTSCVLLSGLPEDLFPGLPAIPLLAMKSSMGPLSGAMVLLYLKQWLGVSAEDRQVHHIIHWGSLVLMVCAVVMALVSAIVSEREAQQVFLIAATLNGLAIALVAYTSLRAAQLGDPVGRTMAIGTVFLTLSLTGLLRHQITAYDSDPPWVWAGSAFSTVMFFLVMVMLGIQRNQQLRKLERLSNLAAGVEPATGLPSGSMLLSKVDDAFWRSDRLSASSIVIALHLHNLYELSESEIPSIDLQILAAMAARIRRAVGFRCVVGLYHPRCFVVVLSVIKQPKAAEKMTERLCDLMCEPLDVQGPKDQRLRFTPQFSVGMVVVRDRKTSPAQTIDEAEKIALLRRRPPSQAPVTAFDATTEPTSLG